jgi:hypothetical protein
MNPSDMQVCSKVSIQSSGTQLEILKECAFKIGHPVRYGKKKQLATA